MRFAAEEVDLDHLIRGAAAGFGEQRLGGVDRGDMCGAAGERDGRAADTGADVENRPLVNTADHVGEDALLLGRHHRADRAAETSLFEGARGVRPAVRARVSCRHVRDDFRMKP